MSFKKKSTIDIVCNIIVGLLIVIPIGVWFIPIPLWIRIIIFLIFVIIISVLILELNEGLKYEDYY